MPGLRALQSLDPVTELRQARELLTGEHKDAEQAKKLLLDIVQRGKAAVGAESFTYVHVYLGYIEDRAGDRQGATSWFQKALAIEGGSPGIQAVAKTGLNRPVTWIRHLDGDPSAPVPPPSNPSAAPRVTKAYVAPEAPAGMTLKRNLTAGERLENFDALWNAIDYSYAGFKLKSIDWAEVGRRYRSRLDAAIGDDDFYALMFQLVNELKDAHSWLDNYKAPPLAEPADVAIDMIEGKPFVTAAKPGSAVTPGWEVVSIDGATVAEKIQALRTHLHAYSSERAWRREAVRHLLAGEKGEPASVVFRTPEGATRTVVLPRSPGPAPRPPARTPPFPVTAQRYVDFGREPSGLGYIRIRSFSGHGDLTDEFDRALEALRDTRGLILDIRDNPGGFGQPHMVGRLLHKRSLASISYVKAGARHSALEKRKGYLDPSGAWQYLRPIALLVNGGTASAAELFASELRSARRVVTIGATTHGDLSGVADFAVLPCGLVVRISNGYVCDAKGRPIEVNGNTPDIAVDPTISDVLSGRDPVLDKAVHSLRADI